MAKAISEEELQLRKRARRRLIGAVALVTVVTVFLPMVLDHEPRPINHDISIQIPSPSSGGAFTSKIVPVIPGGPGNPAQRENPEEKGIPEIPPPPTVPARPEPIAQKDASQPARAQSANGAAAPRDAEKKGAPKATEKTVAKAEAGKEPTTAKSGGFVVQVAALNDPAKAQELQQKMSAAGFKSYTEVVPTTKGNVTRVRAGPYASRSEAESVRDKLKGMGLNGNILPR